MSYNHLFPPSSANVKIVQANNATFQEAYQFDPLVPGVVPVPPAWSLFPNLRMDIKAYHEQLLPLLSLTSGAGQIIVDDPVNRLIHFNVPETAFTGASMVPGCYVYDLIMFDGSTPPIRIPIMHGEFVLTDGVTGG